MLRVVTLLTLNVVQHEWHGGGAAAAAGDRSTNQQRVFDDCNTLPLAATARHSLSTHAVAPATTTVPFQRWKTRKQTKKTDVVWMELSLTAPSPSLSLFFATVIVVVAVVGRRPNDVTCRTTTPTHEQHTHTHTHTRS